MIGEGQREGKGSEGEKNNPLRKSVDKTFNRKVLSKTLPQKNASRLVGVGGLLWGRRGEKKSGK